MLPYLQWSVSHPQDSEDPTVSPVPSSVNGTVQLLVYNNASYAITVRRAVRLRVLLYCCLRTAVQSHNASTTTLCCGKAFGRFAKHVRHMHRVSHLSFRECS